MCAQSHNSMLTIESLFTSGHFFGPLRNILDMTTSSISDHGKPESSSEEPTASQTVDPSANQEQTRSGPRPRRRRITRPEPGSLYDIMHEHCGTSLYVPPICWTDLHAQLLGVRFVELAPVILPVPGPKHCGWNACPPSQIANNLGHELTTLLTSEKTSRWHHKTQAIKSVLSTLFPATLSRPKSNAELDIYCGGRVFRKAVRVPVLWKHPECAETSFDSAVTKPAVSFDRISTSCQDHASLNSSPPRSSRPLLAYINRKQLSAIRQHLYRIQPGPANGDQYNTPVRRLQQLRSKQLIPANADHDAHYLGTLLAMAQSYFYNDQSSKSSSQTSSRSGTSGKSIDVVPSSFSDVKVQLITHADETSDFVVYTAVVTSTFLERFAHPTKAPAKSETKGQGNSDADEDIDAGLEVTYARVPVWPILGLKERLGRALGRDIAGYTALFDGENADNIETWLSPEERSCMQRLVKKNKARSGGKKRRRGEKEQRGILAEMVNSSFETDDDAASCASASEDLPVLSPDAKRRCTRTVNPLEVC